MTNNQIKIANGICKFFTDHGISDAEKRQNLFDALSGYESERDGHDQIILKAIITGIFIQYDNFISKKTREKIEVLMSQMTAKDQKIKELQSYIDEHILK